jgi:hypothetical protein
MAESISELLQNSDKSMFMDFVNEHLGKSTKGVVIFALPKDRDGLQLYAYQFGNKYVYELEGFTNWIANATEDLFSNEE